MICKQRFDITFIPSVSDLDRESYELLQIKYTAACAEIQLQTGYKCREFGYNLMTGLYKSYSSPWGRVTSWIHFPVRMRRAHRGTFSRLSAWMAAATSQ